MQEHKLCKLLSPKVLGPQQQSALMEAHTLLALARAGTMSFCPYQSYAGAIKIIQNFTRY